MLSQDTKYRLGTMLTDYSLADQVEARLISDTPADASEAQAVLDTMDSSKAMKDTIAQRMYFDMAGSGAEGREIARKLNGMVEVLKAQVNAAAAIAATFSGQVAGMTTDVDLEADTAGSAGNDILLEFDGVLTISDAVDAWNLANPSNTVSVSSGDDSQVPDDGETIQLSGGEDEKNADAAKEAMGDEHMSDELFEALAGVMTERSAAEEFRTAYDAMIDAVQAIVAP